MERRSPRIQELRQKHELSCMWGLFNVIESCQSRTSRKLISNGRPVNKNIIDYPRKLDQIASFDEECRRIQLQNEADWASVTVDASARSAVDMPFEKHKTKQNIVKGRQHGSELVDLLVKTHKRAKQSGQKPYQSSLCRLNNELPSTSADISLNELTLAAILRAVCAQNHGQEESIQMSAKAFVDQMFIHKKLVSKNGMYSESKSSSNAFAKECEDLGPSSSFEKTGNKFAAQKGKMDKNLWQKSSKTIFVAQPSDRIVILKPAPQNAKYSENVTCHCSSLQSHKKLSRRAADVKPTSFSFREMKKKLKHSFRWARKEPNEFSTVGTSDQLSCDRSTLKVENLRNEQGLKSSRGFDITGRENLDFSSVGISSKKQDFDVILEAKKHLSARFKNLNAVETVTSKKSMKTLGRILSSPKHDFWPVSSRRDGQYGFGFAQMRFSPCNTSPRFSESISKIPNGREGACLSPLRANTEVALSDVNNKYDGSLQIMQSNKSSLIPSTDEGARDTDSSASDDVKSKGELNVVEMDSTLGPLLHTCEIPSEITTNDFTKTMKKTETTESHKDVGTDPLSENEVSASTVDDFPSTPSSTYRLDTSDTIKYQEEHRSPVSVLEPFCIEDANSPPCVTFQTDGQQLKPRRLDFDQCSFESFLCMQEQDHLSQYVHSVLQASCLNWDQLSEIMSPHEELLDSFLIDEVEFLPTDCCFDPKLLFDRINEVLLETYNYHFCSPPWLAFVKPNIKSVPLAELVLGEIMKEAEFFLPPRTEKRTLDQLVSKDVAKCGSWLDVLLDTEEIVIEISEDFMEEFILDVLVEFYT